MLFFRFFDYDNVSKRGDFFIPVLYAVMIIMSVGDVKAGAVTHNKHHAPSHGPVHHGAVSSSVGEDTILSSAQSAIPHTPRQNINEQPSSSVPSNVPNAPSPTKGSLVRGLAGSALTTIVDGTLGTAMNSANAVVDAGRYAIEGTKNVVVGARDVAGGLVSIGGDVKDIAVAAGKGAVNVAKDLTRSRKNPTTQIKTQSPENGDIDVNALILDVNQFDSTIPSTESLDGGSVESSDPSLAQSTSRVDDVLGDIKEAATDIKNNAKEIVSKTGDIALDGLTAGADATHAFSGAAGAIINDPLLGSVAKNTIDTAANTATGVAKAALSDATLGASTVVLEDVEAWLPNINASDVVSAGINTLNTTSGIVAESLHEKRTKRDKKRSQEQEKNIQEGRAEKQSGASSAMPLMQGATAANTLSKTNASTSQSVDDLLKDVATDISAPQPNAANALSKTNSSASQSVDDLLKDVATGISAPQKVDTLVENVAVAPAA